MKSKGTGKNKSRENALFWQTMFREGQNYVCLKQFKKILISHLTEADRQ